MKLRQRITRNRSHGNRIKGCGGSVMSGGLLILTILLLGGVIAAIGDRLGFKVGKAKLSIFGLRPRDTAVVATIFTGFMISAVTMGLILLVSEQVRVGLFELDGLLADLNRAKTEKNLVQSELALAQQEQQLAQQKRQAAEAKLTGINQKLQRAQQQQQAATLQLKTLQTKILTLQKRSTDLAAQSIQAQSQLSQAQAQVKILRTEENKLLARQRGLQTQNAQLQKSLVASQAELQRLLETGTLLIRRGDFIIQAQDILETGIISSGLNATRQREALFELLSRAGQTALKKGANSEETLLINPDAVTKTLQALATSPQEMIVQVFAAQNVLNREAVPVAIRVLSNTILFQDKEILANAQITLPLEHADLEDAFKDLFQRASKRARNAGILLTERGDVGFFPEDALKEMMTDLQRYRGPVEIRAITEETVYTAGPLALSLVALQNNKVIARAP